MNEVVRAQESTVLGTGIVASWDSRNRIFYPHSGFWGYISTLMYSEGFIGQHNFSQLILDAQKYFPLSARQVIGLQFYFEGVNGEVPFSILPPMGGSQYMRGYYEGRFRDNIFTTLQGEWRFPIKSRFRGGVFVGMGEVAGSVAELSTSYVEFSGGSGLRYRLNEEGIHIRLDYAIGEKGNGLYITTLQPF